MKREEVQSKIIEIVSENLGLKEDKLKENLEQKLSELGADSLDEIEIVMEIEVQFKIDIPDSKLDELNSINKLTDYTLLCLN